MLAQQLRFCTSDQKVMSITPGEIRVMMLCFQVVILSAWIVFCNVLLSNNLINILSFDFILLFKQV